MKANKELVGASTGILVLSVLAKEASYGYRIIKRINEEAQGLFVWQEGTVYPVLHKLEQEGLVRAQWQQAETGRDRRYYYITSRGRDALREGAREWKGFHEMILRLVETPNA
jgi:PadR family transcriptional regulator PadR